MKDMSREKFRDLLAGVFVKYDGLTMASARQRASKMLVSFDEALAQAITSGEYNGIRVTETLRLGVVMTLPKTYRNLRTKEIETSPAKLKLTVRSTGPLQQLFSQREQAINAINAEGV